MIKIPWFLPLSAHRFSNLLPKLYSTFLLELKLCSFLGTFPEGNGHFNAPPGTVMFSRRLEKRGHILILFNVMARVRVYICGCFSYNSQRLLGLLTFLIKWHTATMVCPIMQCHWLDSLVSSMSLGTAFQTRETRWLPPARWAAARCPVHTQCLFPHSLLLLLATSPWSWMHRNLRRGNKNSRHYSPTMWLVSL